MLTKNFFYVSLICILTNLYMKIQLDPVLRGREIDVLVEHSDFDANFQNLSSSHSDEFLVIDAISI